MQLQAGNVCADGGARKLGFPVKENEIEGPSSIAHHKTKGTNR